jgi:hypothetical protein
MVSQNSPAILQLQMREIRRNLNEHTDQVVEKARTQLDWRRHVANHPWTSLSIAMLAGYLLVPRRAGCQAVDANHVGKSMERTARAVQPSSQSAASTITAGLGSVIAATLVREGVGLFSQFVRQWLESSTDPSVEGPGGKEP